jgi:hypothetical protein
MKIVEKNGCGVAVLDSTERIRGVQDFLDRMADANFRGCVGMVVFPESLGGDFFDLRTRYAGEILQKCSNYCFRFAVVGDFSRRESKSLRDFIYECNQRKESFVFFPRDLESALERMTV